MAIPEFDDIDRAAVNLYDNIRAIKRACDAVSSNPSASIVIEMHHSLIRAQKAIAGHIVSPIPIASMGAALERRNGVVWADMVDNFTTIHNTAVPALIQTIESNWVALMAFSVPNQEQGAIQWLDVTGAARTALMARVNAVLTEFS